MTSEDTRYSNNDTGTFAGFTYELVYGGPGPQELDMDMRDRDVMVNVWVDRETVRLLHLQNVRDDTVDTARNAVDGFLNELKSIDDRQGAHLERLGHTMLESFTPVHADLCDYLKMRAEELGLRFKWEHGGFPRESFRRACSQPKYLVRFREDGSLDRITGTRGVPYPVARGSSHGGDDGDRKEA